MLDHAAAETGYGGKLALDLTGVPEGEVPLLAVPERIVPAGGIAAWSMAFYAEWGIVALYAEPGAEADIAAFVRENCPEARIAVLFDTAAQGLDGGDLLWPRPIPMPGAISVSAAVRCWPMRGRSCRGAGRTILRVSRMWSPLPKPRLRLWMHGGRSMT